MNWKRALIARMTRGKYQAFLQDTQQPQLAQSRLWTQEILPLLNQAPYWKPRLQGRQSLADFPITVYEDYHDELVAAQNSKIQPFNGEELIFWSETSGTAGVRKYFPITASFQKQFQRTMPPFIHSLTKRFSGFFKEKMLYLVAVNAHKYTPAGTPSGWISNFNYRNLPFFMKRCYATPDAVFENTDVYNQWAPLYALACDLSAVFAVTPMVIDAFYERCVAGFSEYIPYLMGKKAIPQTLPPIKISRKRRQHLTQLLQTNAELTFAALWPSLELAGCWTSGLCEFPAQALQKRMGDAVNLVDGTYSATEGWLTVPMESNQLGGVLHPGAHIVEFIEEDQPMEKDNLIPCWQLEQGKKYEVFLTTAMGFVRYQLKDVVQCTGFINQAPKLEFCYKTQLLKLESCAITGQELQAMLQAQQFCMAAHWYFARNSQGNRIVLVTDNSTEISDTQLRNLHQQLIQISPTYAHSVETGEVIPMAQLALPLTQLQQNNHAQTKPKLISQDVIVQI